MKLSTLITIATFIIPCYAMQQDKKHTLRFNQKQSTLAQVYTSKDLPIPTALLRTLPTNLKSVALDYNYNIRRQLY